MFLLIFILFPFTIFIFCTTKTSNKNHKQIANDNNQHNISFVISISFCVLLKLIGLCQNFAEVFVTTIDSEAPTVPPKFVTRGHLYKAVIGDTIILPCKVKDLGM